MSDYLSQLKDQLEDAAERQAGARRRVARPWAWLVGHLAISLTGGAVLAAGAGAAFVLQTSGGTSGTVRPSSTTAGPMVESSLAYNLSVAPSLRVGEPGWCTRLELRNEDGAAPALVGAGCGAAPTGDGAEILSASTQLGEGRGQLAYAIVSRSVGYATLDSGVRLVPRPDDRLPGDWRVLIAGPNESGSGTFKLFSTDDSPLHDGERKSVVAQPPRTAAGAIPSSAECHIRIPRDAVPTRSRWLDSIGPSRGLSVPSFLPCGQTTMRYRGAWSQVTVLLDAAAPGTSRPATLSGSEVDGDVEFPAYDPSYLAADGKLAPLDEADGSLGDRATARRVGNAWLVVRAANRTDRERLLDECTA